MALLLGALVLLAGCGPEDDEVAASVLLVSPIAFATCIGVLALFYSFELPPKPRWPLWPAGIGFGASLIAAVVASTLPEGEVGMRFFSITLYIFGASLLTVVMVVWAVFRFAGARRAAYTWSWAVPLIVMLVPAAVIIGGHGEVPELVRVLWVYTGWFGAPTVVIFALLLVVQILSSRNAFDGMSLDEIEAGEWAAVPDSEDDEPTPRADL